MTTYTSAVRAGPPRQGRFVFGDIVIDRNQTQWRCVATGWPGTWLAEPEGIPLGAVNDTAVTATARGTEIFRRTRLDFTGLQCPITDATQFSGKKIFTFPEGAVLILGATGSVVWSVSSDRSTTINDNAGLNWSAGSVTASNTTLSGTMVNFIPQTAVTLSAAGALPNTASSALMSTTTALNGTTTPVAVFLNTSIPLGTDIDADGVLVASGSISVVWVSIGDI